MTLSSSTEQSDDSARHAVRAEQFSGPAEHFAFAGSDHLCSARGGLPSFDDPRLAAESLARGDHAAIVGALAFDSRTPSALTAPAHVCFEPRPTTWTATQGAVSANIVAAEPRPTEHRERVDAAVAVLADPASPLAKVVLARKLLLHSADLSPELLCAALATQNPESGIFRTSLAPAGAAYHGRYLVGASPEVLVRRRGTRVSAHPLAGSAARHRDPTVDTERARTLSSSAKDLGEHSFVIEALRSALTPLCSHLDVPEAPSIVRTSTMWHLGTPIVGELADASTTALDLAIAVHPTPAVCGTPTDTAREYIRATEGDRGFYGGAVGWCLGELAPGTRPGEYRGADGATVSDRRDMAGTLSSGDGEWLVAIRCAEIDSRTGDVTTWAGGGIVAESDPDAEVTETTAKLRTVLRALGADED
ncbi:isochorismate synthase [Gordonia aichiensis]|uniref:Putative isochorismate synthase n=1 Tax=Gordonia aichiensis NBRC 108223 TaxID=1220583 RepID=L7KIH2_9ACTN|nr:chorismate-binding protein [Gordonia aichiensis]GAC48409.1 putative isochorismate synthase [Gordonia aichiensis NBRC 108223]